MAYAAATEYLRSGEQFLASQQYEKALQIDSTFASAWSGLSTALSNMGVRRADRDRAVFRAFDLRDTPVVNDELDDAVAQAFNFFADQRHPIGRGSDEGGRGITGGGGHITVGLKLNGIFAEKLVKDPLGFIEARKVGTPA